MKKYLLALATFSGTIIGVGLFGLPYVTSKIGFLPVIFYFLFLGFVVIIIQLLFGEITLRTIGKHRLPGYVKIYLGKKAKILALITNSLGLYGAVLAYLIVGGGFLANLLIPFFGGNVLIYTLIFFATGALIIYFGTRVISETELFSLVLFFGVLIFLIIKGLPFIKTEYFLTFDYHYFFLPYGIILFSLWGMAVIPEIKEILTGQEKQLKNLIPIGILIPIITYLAFIFLVLGVSGINTTTDALTGLKNILGEKILMLGFLFGIITTFTSYLTLGLTLKKNFWYDLKLPHFPSWILACFIPLLAYFVGLKNFIVIIAFTGAATLGIDGILVFLIYLKAKKIGQRVPAYSIKIPHLIIYILIGLFLLGVMTELSTFIF